MIETNTKQESSLFRNSVLKNEFINPNYNGLIGWEIDYEYALVAVRRKRAVYVNANGDVHTTPVAEIKIKEFTPKDIPAGELIWCSKLGRNWTLERFVEFNSNGHYVTLDYDIASSHHKLYKQWHYGVPYLVAETAEDAKSLNDWNQIKFKKNIMNNYTSLKSSTLTKPIRPKGHIVTEDFNYKNEIKK